jgi:NADH dehydrogenase
LRDRQRAWTPRRRCADAAAGAQEHGMADASPGADLHRIVIAGGGAAGLELATRLGDRLGRRGEASVVLVDRARGHLWKPLLHEVAAGSMDPDEHELGYLAQAHWHHFRFRHGEMVGLDRAAKTVLLAPTFDEDGREVTPGQALPYDTLVIAIGSTTNDFGTPGVREHAIALETTQQAVRFNRRLVNACLRAHGQDAPVRPGQLHVAIIGAGATGTELAAELHHFARAVVAYGLDRIDPDKDIRITLIEAAPRILAVGAQAAHQQATHLFRTIRRRLKGEPPLPFVYRDFGSLVSLGEYSTVGSLMGFLAGRSMWVEGLFARLMYRSLYKMHERALHGTVKTALGSLARSLSRRTEPRVKLH